ncbi:VOC family protein [candidate division WOR-3 bacterium]|nr:VOC family protein [candidate division WOR-3 bacterium]
MAGIVFFKTDNMEKTLAFYVDAVGMDVWLEQKNCVILRHENMLLGFCLGEMPRNESLITFFYSNKKKVDEIYEKLKNSAQNQPKYNKDYDIYHFYAEDPQGRVVEFQFFCSEIQDNFIWENSPKKT